MQPLRFTYDSVMGYEHLRLKKNCQDSLLFYETDGLVIGFVADGMGDNEDSPFSEVGSRIAVKLAVEYVSERLAKTFKWRRANLISSEKFWVEVQQHILENIRNFANLMGGNYKSNIVKYFMFTLTGFVMTPDVTVVVGVGDGFFVLNEQCFRIAEPSENNMPAALAYNLVESKLRQMSPEEITLSIKYQFDTDGIDSMLIATDGLRFLLDDSLLVKEEYRFWREILYFDNPFSLGWKLKELSSEKKTVDWKEQRVKIQKPILSDDLALIIASKI